MIFVSHILLLSPGSSSYIIKKASAVWFKNGVFKFRFEINPSGTNPVPKKFKNEGTEKARQDSEKNEKIDRDKQGLDGRSQWCSRQVCSPVQPHQYKQPDQPIH